MTSSHERDFELTGAPGTLKVGGVLSFDTAAAALQAIHASMDGGDIAELDLSGVRHCDSAGLACVLAVSAEAHRRGTALRVTNMPQGMRALAQVCEVDHLMA